MNKVAIITGAGSGVGRHVSIGLLKEGYSVVLAGRREDQLYETVKLANANSSNALVVPTDVSVRSEVERLFQVAKRHFDHLDILFNNAGVTATNAPLEEIALEDWNKVIGVNMSGPFFCTQEGIKWMKQQNPIGGRIINNGSISSQVPRPNAAPYNMSKSAITGLTKSTILEGRPYNILCGQIDLGNVSTDMTAKMGKGVIQADGSIKTEPTFEMKHLVDAFLYLAGLPLTVNVPFITVMANGMPFIGRG